MDKDEIIWFIENALVDYIAENYKEGTQEYNRYDNAVNVLLDMADD